MEFPPEGTEVFATFADGSTSHAFWGEGVWTVGVEYEDEDLVLPADAVIAWTWRS
jgi:hypothetical protein